MYQTYPYSLSVCNNTCIEIKDNHNNNDELVILSKQTLTEYQKQVLRKGLNFIPKPKKLNILQIHNDIRLFMHRMKLQFELHNKTPKHNTQRDPFKPKKHSIFNHERLTDNGRLDTFLHRIRLEIVDEQKHKQNTTDNLTRNERKALNELTTNPTIIINKADKGSTIVVQDRDEYIADAMTHLADKNTYTPLKENTTNILKEQINAKLRALYENKFLLKHWYEYCKPPTNHRTSRLYFLKKIHKTPMGNRPIVSSCESITEKISQFVDRWLQPYVQNLPSYIKDTTEFINLIEQTTFPTKCKLASIDVSSLYTNIPHDEGIKSTLFFLKTDPNKYKYPEQPTPEVIGELINLVLKHNVFEFNEKFYLQTQGTAMGTKMAPAYANLFMGKLEKDLINIANQHIHTWKRFIDDIFIIWTGTTQEFESYMKKINQIHPTIKFTHEISDTELTFLDVTLYKGERFQTTNILDLRTHIKNTNKQLYVHSKSYHPPSTIKAISKGETKRYLRTNSNETNFEKMKCKLVNKLKQRGYKHNQIVNHIKDIKFNERNKTLKRKHKPQQSNKLIFTTHYNDDINRIKGIFKKHWTLIKNDPYLKQVFPTPPIIAYKANPSIRNKLVRAKLAPLNTSISETHSNNKTQTHNEPIYHTQQNYPLNLFLNTSQNFRNPIKRCTNKCITCKEMDTKSFALSTTKLMKHPIKQPPPNKHYNCQSKNVVYLITCKETNCNAQYVGYTTRKLAERFKEHKTNHNSQIHKHCSTLNHNKLKLQILTQPLDNEPNPELWLKQQEYYWICKLGTLTKFNPKGLYDPTIRNR